jgi:hypothetical protein
MPKTPSFDRDALAALLNKQHGVGSREQTAACGLPPHLVRYRVRADGPWQVLMPGVYLTHTGAASDDQKDMAALLYAGRMSAYGILVLHFTPGQIRSERHEVTTAIRKALTAGRPLPAVRALPAD